MNEELLLESAISRYSSAAEIRHYEGRSNEGLRIWEKNVVVQYMQRGKVLSIGCGGGRESFALEKLGFLPFGIDISRKQVESANRTKKKLSSGASFKAYSGVRIPFSDSFFPSVTMWSQVLGNVPTRRRRLEILEESHRILEPGGIVSLSVHDLEKTKRLIDIAGQQYEESEDLEPGDLLLAQASGESCYWHYFKMEELREICAIAGFTVLVLSTSDEMGQDYDNLIIVVCQKPLCNVRVTG
jgi:SAM-dependent methyltransferase